MRGSTFAKATVDKVFVPIAIGVENLKNGCNLVETFFPSLGGDCRLLTADFFELGILIARHIYGANTPHL